MYEYELFKQLFAFINLILFCSTVSWGDFWYSSSSDHPLRLSLNVPVSLFPFHIYVRSHSYYCHLQNGCSLLTPMFGLTPSSAHISTDVPWFLPSYQLNPWLLGSAQELLRQSSLAARHPSGQLSPQVVPYKKPFCTLFLFSPFLSTFSFSPFQNEDAQSKWGDDCDKDAKTQDQGRDPTTLLYTKLPLLWMIVEPNILCQVFRNAHFLLRTCFLLIFSLFWLMASSIRPPGCKSDSSHSW